MYFGILRCLDGQIIVALPFNLPFANNFQIDAMQHCLGNRKSDRRRQDCVESRFEQNSTIHIEHLHNCRSEVINHPSSFENIGEAKLGADCNMLILSKC